MVRQRFARHTLRLVALRRAVNEQPERKFPENSTKANVNGYSNDIVSRLTRIVA